MHGAEKCLVKLLLKKSENLAAKVQREIELEILDSKTIYDVTLERLEQKYEKFKQKLEKRRDKKTENVLVKCYKKNDMLGIHTQKNVMEKELR